jgi:hypothetical protein
VAVARFIKEEVEEEAPVEGEEGAEAADGEQAEGDAAEGDASGEGEKE